LSSPIYFDLFVRFMKIIILAAITIVIMIVEMTIAFIVPASMVVVSGMVIDIVSEKNPSPRSLTAQTV